MIIVPNNFISKEIEEIFNIFGEDIRLVGGCVRDMILDKPVADYDFACKLSPSKIIEKLNINNITAIPTGIKFGTITAVVNHKNFQITTLRNDFNYDGRHCQVDFTDDFFEDAKRRDFTINALYLDKNLQIYDYFNGIEDLQNNKVRFIGDANQRISEDYLRIMRFLRFSCHYGNEIDKQTLEICLKHRHKLLEISHERIREEFYKIISANNVSLVLEIIKIFYDKKIDINLWGCSLDYQAFNNFLISQKYLDKISIKAIKIISIFNITEENKNIFFKKFICTKLEKKIINIYQKISHEYDLSNIKNAELNKLLINFDKQLLIKIFIIFQAKNSLKLSQNNLENIILYIINIKIPSFPLMFEDFKSLNFDLKNLNLMINKLKNLWAVNDFNLSKEELLKYIK
jgi:poly(A) polymerase